MDKILNRMYDIFAFALPGMSIIAIILMSKSGGELLYKQLPDPLKNHETIFLLMIAFGGYLIGYLLMPLSKMLLKCILKSYSKFMFHKIFRFEQKEIAGLLAELNQTTLSHKFVKIREKAANSAQYIEFWDMHMYFSINMCVAVLTFIVVWVLNFKEIDSLLFFISGLLISIGSFLALLYNAIHYGIWWKNDIEEALKYIAKEEK